MSATLRLPAEPASVPRARRFVLQQLERWSLTALTDTAVLLTSEVVTNAVLHARTEVEVTVTRMGRAVQVQVRDGSPVTPVSRSYGAEATTGRGVRLLEQLASSWDVAAHDGGKTVCFVVDGSDPRGGGDVSAWQDLDL